MTRPAGTETERPMDQCSRPVTVRARTATLARHATLWLIVGGAYSVAAWIGLLVTPTPLGVSLFWPSSGIAVAAVMIVGVAAVPPLFIAATWFYLGMSIAAPFALAAGAGVVFAAAVGAWLLHRIVGRNVLDSPSGPASLLLIAAIASGGISGLTGAAAMAATDGGITFTDMWWACWVAHFTGVAFVTPLVLAWGQGEDRLPPMTLETGLIAALAIALAAVSYSGLFGMRLMETLSYAVFPGLIWAAVRLDGRIATSLLTVTAAIAIGCTMLGHGPFAGSDPVLNLLSLHVHLLILAMTILVIVAATAQRRKADRQSAATLATLAQAGRISALGEMAAGLAHELNQPLQALKSYAQAAVKMAGKGDDRGVIDALQRIVATSDRAAGILQSIRSYIGGRSDNAGSTDIAQLVDEVVGLLNHDPVRRGVTITVRIEDNLPPVHAAPVQIQQVLVNLIRNACEATGPGGTVLVHASLSKDVMSLSVDDNGPGLPDRDDLFMPFASEKPNGLGLGLAISKRIAEAHGGSLTAGRSEMGGARVSLGLPVMLRRLTAA